ncbi:L,D-transpeptidase family protein [Thermoflavifilum thermophilum]|uniref:L,D-transpeptidase catalytic domain n=1 Tax=Thermoflavifilum thermophilum TaxID=1393122 RepID=A0A1I7NCK7_9BACT|nr:L,D-transpeptidase [Thermoflavifilum thermophilum]SFV32408.1 L,D-transpeptidase catalytic domain [Thermoflavifilum thermophilum]
MLSLISLIFSVMWVLHPADPGDRIDVKHVDPDKVFLLIDKLHHRLYVYEDTRLLASFPAVFGSNDLSDKMMAGDRKTPEGLFHIIAKRYDNRWCRFLLLDYPTTADYQKFNARKAAHLIPENAQIGGGIGIHGTWPKDDFVFTYMQNWTNGCISIPNEAIRQIFEIVKIGTPVLIKRQIP